MDGEMVRERCGGKMWWRDGVGKMWWRDGVGRMEWF